MYFHFYTKCVSILIFTTIVLVSCKSKSSQQDVYVNEGVVKATINGEDWETNGASASKVNLGNNSQPGFIGIVATKVVDQSSNNFETLQFYIYTNIDNGVIGEGTYDLLNIDNPDNDNVDKAAELAYGIAQGEESTAYISSSGMLEITSLTSDNIQGKFEGLVVNDLDGSDTIEIKNGEFNVKINDSAFPGTFAPNLSDRLILPSN